MKKITGTAKELCKKFPTRPHARLQGTDTDTQGVPQPETHGRNEYYVVLRSKTVDSKTDSRVVIPKAGRQAEWKPTRLKFFRCYLWRYHMPYHDENGRLLLTLRRYDPATIVLAEVALTATSDPSSERIRNSEFSAELR